MNVNSTRKSKNNLLRLLLFIVPFLGVLFFLLWRCRYGLGNIDESFYLTVPLRLLQGDSLLVNEWHLSQLVSVLLLPFVAVYLAIFKSTVGIILSFRYIYVAVMAVTTVFVYFRLRKYSDSGAVWASLAYFAYAPFGISALSYNSLGIINLVMSLTLLATAEKNVRVQYVFSGLFFAAAVLCCPYLAAVYLLFAAAVLLMKLPFVKKFSFFSESSTGKTVEKWLWFTVGVVLLAVIFSAFLLSRASIKDIIDSFKGIMSDPEHASSSSRGPVTGFLYRLVQYFLYIVFTQRPLFRLLYAVLAADFVVMLAGRKKEIVKKVCFSCAVVCCILLTADLFVSYKYINYVMFPVCTAGLISSAAVSGGKARKLFHYFWLPGMLYTLCIYFTSNMEKYVIPSASTVALVPSVVMIFMSAKEIFGKDKPLIKSLAGVLLAALFVIQFGSECYLRYSKVFWEKGGIAAQTEPMNYGIEKGIVTSPESVRKYKRIEEVTKYINSVYTEKNVLFFSSDTFGYLECSTLRSGAYSAWLALTHDTTPERMALYYKINPDKVPDIIYVRPPEFEIIGTFDNYGKYEKVKTFSDGSILLEKTD